MGSERREHASRRRVRFLTDRVKVSGLWWAAVDITTGLPRGCDCTELTRASCQEARTWNWLQSER